MLDDDIYQLLVSRYREINPQFDNIYKEYCTHLDILAKSKNTEKYIPEFNEWVEKHLWKHHGEMKKYSYP